MDSDNTLAYIAGFFDGEGCIIINSKSGLLVQIVNSDKKVLSIIAFLLEGSHLYSQKRYGRKDIWRIHICGPYAADALELILPYLIVKKDLAELAVEFYDNCYQCRTPHKLLDDAERALRVSYAKRAADIAKSTLSQA